MHNDFVDITKTVDFFIDDKKFTYRCVTAGEENDWLNECAIINSNGTITQDLAKLNKLKVNNLVGVPYTKEDINDIIKIDKDWKDLTLDQKWQMFGLLKPSMFDKIFKQIRGIDNPDIKKKDDS